MNARKLLLRALLLIIGLPLLAILVVIVYIRILDRTNGSIAYLGQRRSYLLHVPPSYDRTRPTPLVISLHGAAAWPAEQMHLSRWNRLADSAGFIVVYPAGDGPPRIWHVERGDELLRDVGFISALIDTLEAAYTIDPARIYANGLSNGGGMAFVLSCTLSDRIAAIGMVAAAQTLPWSWCTDHHPVPMINFHGTADPIVPYLGGDSPIAPDLFPSIPAWTGNWARRNRCGASPVDSVIAPDVTRLEYSDCADSAAVLLYTIQGGGHTWPGGKPLPRWLAGSTSNSIDATGLMWTFFREHPLRKPAPAEPPPP
jgi:polyhydroxybutyrate depolymerase